MHDLPKSTWFIFILPILTIILLVNVADYYVLIKTEPKSFVYIVMLMLLNVIIVIIFLFAFIFSYMKNRLKTALYKEELLNSKFDLLTQHYHYNFHFLHDLLHTCNRINLLLDHDEYIQVKNEMKKLTEQTFKEFNTIYTNSVTLNYIININLNRIKENQINMKTVFEYNCEFLNFETQLNLFDFLINLSIDCCTKSDITPRTVIFKSKIRSNYFILQLILPYAKKILMK